MGDVALTGLSLGLSQSPLGRCLQGFWYALRYTKGQPGTSRVKKRLRKFKVGRHSHGIAILDISRFGITIPLTTSQALKSSGPGS